MCLNNQIYFDYSLKWKQIFDLDQDPLYWIIFTAPNEAALYIKSTLSKRLFSTSSAKQQNFNVIFVVACDAIIQKVRQIIEYNEENTYNK